MTLATRTINGNNSGPYLRRPKIVVVHATRSGVDWTDAEELGATLSWFVNPDGASSHWVLSELERARVVRDDLIAWHSAYLNSRSWGIELTQPTIDRPFTDGHYTNLILVGRRYVSLGVAPVWLPYWDGNLEASGFVAHQNTKQGRESGKSDPGPEFDSTRFITGLEDDMTEAEVNALIDKRLKLRLEGSISGSGEMRFPAENRQGDDLPNVTTLKRWLGNIIEHREDGNKHSAGEAHSHTIPASTTEES